MYYASRRLSACAAAGELRVHLLPFTAVHTRRLLTENNHRLEWLLPLQHGKRSRGCEHERATVASTELVLA